MSLTIAVALSFSFSQIFLSILLLLRQQRRWSRQEWVFCLFLSSVVAYLLDPVLEYHWLKSAQLVWQNTLPGFFWLFCGCLFNDRFKLTMWNTGVVALVALLPALARNLSPLGIELPVWLFIHIPQMAEFVLIAWALLIVVQSWQDDLIEIRRDLRFWFCSIAGVYIFATIAVREILFPNANWWSEWQYIALSAISLINNVLLLQYRAGLMRFDELKGETRPSKQSSTPRTPLFPNTEITSDLADSAAPVAKVDVPNSVILRLNSLMQDSHLYREMGLTIGQVAKRMAMPEYKLRRLINAGLGYRNFNDYLNGFRIKEAGARLADPEQASEAVLNIALDVGFRSLSSFNKVFREAFACTPTEYRKQMLTDSEN